jgi:hypothetical protein
MAPEAVPRVIVRLGVVEVRELAKLDIEPASVQFFFFGFIMSH